ncbi:MAG TPA: ABC transporter permease [Candidatus Acidoferrales bacterium]|nr:ABC transporter permease [Candidatus Acidoferrales bacterium]
MPDWKEEIARRLAPLGLGPEREAEIAEELAQHLEGRFEDALAAGAPEAAARSAAMAELSDESLLARGLRRVERSGTENLDAPVKAGRLGFLSGAWRDFRYGVRKLARSPGFAAAAILTLALGIGASTAIFSVVDAVLLRPLPYPNPQQLVRVWEQAPNGRRMNLADPNFDDFRAQNRTLAALAGYSGVWPVSVAGGSEPVRANVAAVSRDFFRVLGRQPFLGRSFAADELRVNGVRATIASYGYWREYLGAARDLSRVRLAMNGNLYSVVGVMPPGFDFPPGAALWIAREADPEIPGRTAHNWRGLGRLRDGATLEQARADLDTIARRIRAEYGKQADLAGAAVVPLAEATVGDVRAALLALFGAVLLLFLVACANVAGLLLARTSARRKELAVRAALGAGRGRLVRQLLAESLELAVAGGVLGIAIAMGITHLLPAVLPADLPGQKGIAINATVLLFTLAATLAVAAGLGLVAAWRAGGADVSDALGAGSRSYTSGSQWARRTLVAGEIAATLVILAGAGVLGRSFLNLLSVSPGFRGQDLMILKFSPPPSASSLRFAEKSPRQIAREVQFLDEALARLRAIPGAQSAALTGGLAVADAEGFPDGTFLILQGQSVPANYDQWIRMAQNPKNTGHADYCVASGEYFRTLGISLIRGRIFDAQDGLDAPNVALISETLARQRWPHEDPIGQTIYFGNMDSNSKPLTIVGIVGDTRAEGLDQPPSPIVYVDFRQRGLSVNVSPAFVLRTSLPASAIVPAARAVFHALDPNIPVQISTYAEALGGWLAERRALALLASVFAGAALVLAAVGLYGLVAHSVARRTQEIGIRMALGAQRGDVLLAVVGEGARLAAIGVAIGLAASLAATRLLSSMLFEVKAADRLTLSVVAALLSAVALLASYIPARRALRIDPIVALRQE